MLTFLSLSSFTKPSITPCAQSVHGLQLATKRLADCCFWKLRFVVTELKHCERSFTIVWWGSCSTVMYHFLFYWLSTFSLGFINLLIHVAVLNWDHMKSVKYRSHNSTSVFPVINTSLKCAELATTSVPSEICPSRRNDKKLKHTQTVQKGSSQSFRAYLSKMIGSICGLISAVCKNIRAVQDV